MALPPQLASLRLGSASSKHTLEFFVDFVCPFSKKQILGVRDHLLPLLKESQTAIIFRPVPQPWHASSTFVHEAAIAVAKLKPEKFWDFSYALFEEQTNYYDEPVDELTPKQVRQSLAKLANKSAGIDEQAFLDLVSIGKGNAGNSVAVQMKQVIRYARQNGVHVTPTVALDGIIDASVSSSFGKDDWQKYVTEKLA